jgi:putative DNA primase/helicase
MVAPGGRLRSHINCERCRFFRNADPFDREVADDTIRWPEGEKDVETLSNQLLLAVTFGGTGDGLPAGCERYFADRDVVILSRQ